MPLDPVAREREYSPSSVIGGDYAPFLERYRAESDAALRTLAVQRDLRYGDASRALIDYFPRARVGAAARAARLLPRRLLAGAVEGGVGVPRAGLARGGVRARGRRLQRWRRRHVFPTSSASAAPPCGGCIGVPTRSASTPATSSPPAARRARIWRPPARTRRPAPLRGIVAVSGIYDVAPLIGTSINDALGLDDATAAAMDLLTTRAPVLPRRRRVGRDRDRGVQAPEPGVRRTARERRDPVHVARSSRPQPLRRGARPGRSGVAALRRRPRAVRGGRAAVAGLRHRGADAEALRHATRRTRAPAPGDRPRPRRRRSGCRAARSRSAGCPARGNRRSRLAQSAPARWRGRRPRAPR